MFCAMNVSTSKCRFFWSEMTLNYRMMVQRYSNLKEEVGGSNPGCESPLYLTENLPGGQLPPMLWRWPIGLLSQKKEKKKEKSRFSKF